MHLGLSKETQSMDGVAETAITLRKFEVGDLDDYMAWASDDKVSRWCTWDAYTDKQHLLEYITTVVLPHPWFRAICVGGRPVGAISLTPCDHRRGEMGYVLGSAHWGRGIVPAAVRMALRAVFEEVEGLERVEALVDVKNTASQRVMEKVGFVREGVLRKYMLLKGMDARDMVIYSFLATDAIDMEMG